MQPHRWQPTRVRCPWDSPGKNTGVGRHFLLQCVKVKLLSCVRLLATPWTAAHQVPPSVGFSRQVYWSGVPLPSPLKQLGTQKKLLVYSLPPGFFFFFASFRVVGGRRLYIPQVEKANEKSFPSLSPQPSAPSPPRGYLSDQFLMYSFRTLLCI